MGVGGEMTQGWEEPPANAGTPRLDTAADASLAAAEYNSGRRAPLPRQNTPITHNPPPANTTPTVTFYFSQKTTKNTDPPLADQVLSKPQRRRNLKTPPPP